MTQCEAAGKFPSWLHACVALAGFQSGGLSGFDDITLLLLPALGEITTNMNTAASPQYDAVIISLSTSVLRTREIL